MNLSIKPPHTCALKSARRRRHPRPDGGAPLVPRVRRHGDFAEKRSARSSRMGLQAPSSCNHQNWHFVAVTDPEMKKRARAISGGNHHFEFCSVLIYLCFQKGWTHDKFSIVQSVAGACYHMMLSAHLRGYATIWNAGIGDTRQVAEMLGIPPTFEIQGALCIGRPKPTAPDMKAPRRPKGEVWSVNAFERPVARDVSGKACSGVSILRDQQCAQSLRRVASASLGLGPHRGFPRLRGVGEVADRGRLPLAASGRDDSGGAELPAEGRRGRPRCRCDAVGRHAHDRTCERVARDVRLGVADLAVGNLIFTQERLRQEGVRQPVDALLMDGPKLPLPDNSVDIDHAVSGAGAHAGAGALARRGRACAQAGRQRASSRCATSFRSTAGITSAR